MGKIVLRVACAQLIHPEMSALGEIGEATIGPHLEMIAKARAGNADVLVFPEMSLTGYLFDARHRDLAIDTDAPALLALAEAAGHMTVGVGFIERSGAGTVFNSFVWLKNGQVLSVHRKINLPQYGQLNEGRYFAPGGHVGLHPVRPGWSAATLICSDVWNPALVHLAALQNPAILVCPFASSREAVGGGFDNPTGWVNTFRFYSMMYGVPGIYCNWIGPVGETNFTGGSCIVGPGGTRIAQAANEQTLIMAELDYDVIREARLRLPTVRTSMPDLVLRELTRILSTPA
jgi:N-carbamoylputrescine amidase